MKGNEGTNLSGIAFVGFFFLGMALGALYDKWAVGPFLGLAMGFIAMLAVRMMYSRPAVARKR